MQRSLTFCLKDVTVFYLCTVNRSVQAGKDVDEITPGTSWIIGPARGGVKPAHREFRPEIPAFSGLAAAWETTLERQLERQSDGLVANLTGKLPVVAERIGDAADAP